MTTEQKSRLLEIWSTYFPAPSSRSPSSDPTRHTAPRRPRTPGAGAASPATRRPAPRQVCTRVRPSAAAGVSWDWTQACEKDFESFLSRGIAGELEGERYKQTPELVTAWMETVPVVPTEKRYVVFKRWDALDEGDEPEVVVFFAIPDVLSGLFTWAGFDEPVAEAVAAPFGAGCASIIQYPLLEAAKERPRAILGMFDVSARPRVPDGVLTFAVPWSKFERMLANARRDVPRRPSPGPKCGAGSPARQARRSSRLYRAVKGEGFCDPATGVPARPRTDLPGDRRRDALSRVITPGRASAQRSRRALGRCSTFALGRWVAPPNRPRC